jgi:hypothetical protein
VPSRFSSTTKEDLMVTIIGVDPPKATHTAVAICGDEHEVAAQVTVRATCHQVSKLLSWAGAI